MSSSAAPREDLGVSARGVPFTRRVQYLGPAGPLRHAVTSVTVYADGAVVRRREELSAEQVRQRYGFDPEQ